MNKNKVSPELLNSVSVLDKNHTDRIFISSNNFWSTKQFLDEYKYRYTPYKFANCFAMNADFDDISILSNQENINFIHSNPIVKIQQLQIDNMNL